MKKKLPKDLKKIFYNKRVLITGHTGFKGSWLSLWMHNMGANVMGISSNIPTKPSHYELIGLRKIIKSRKINIQNSNLLKKNVKKFNPDFVFHLAAQSLVKKSYENPLETWKTNLIGTINILESIKDLKKETVVIIITSDKVYKNLEINRGYKENDLLGGLDPYGASKSAAEISIKSYVSSFFLKKNNKILIATARAGNVIGGGDWSENRLIPDCIKNWSKNKKVLIRNPNSTRPWQHVLDVLNGYINLAASLKISKNFHGEEFNFGPNISNVKVIDILRIIKSNWKIAKWKISKDKKFFENKLLSLNSLKAKKNLGWKNKLNKTDCINFTVDWYRYYLNNKKNKKLILKKSINKINLYEKK